MVKMDPEKVLQFLVQQQEANQRAYNLMIQLIQSQEKQMEEQGALLA